MNNDTLQIIKRKNILNANQKIVWDILTKNLKKNDERTELITVIEIFNKEPERFRNIAKDWDNIALPTIKKNITSFLIY